MRLHTSIRSYTSIITGNATVRRICSLFGKLRNSEINNASISGIPDGPVRDPFMIWKWKIFQISFKRNNARDDIVSDLLIEHLNAHEAFLSFHLNIDFSIKSYIVIRALLLRVTRHVWLSNVTRRHCNFEVDARSCIRYLHLISRILRRDRV